MMEADAMPEGWALTTLDVVSELVAGNPAPQASEAFEAFEDGQVNFVRVQDMGRLDGAVYLRKSRDKLNASAGEKLRLFKEGSVLFTKSGASTLNNQRAILAEDSYVVSHIGVAVPHEGVSSEWLYYAMKQVDFANLAHSSVMPSLPLSKIKDIKIVLPPSAEQHRIVAKIEELFSELDQGVASLKTAREQIKVYRQSLLKNAFEGKLTATWRAEHRDQLEPAAALQQRIAHEREARYQQQLADWQSQGKPGPKPKPPKPLPPLNSEELSELPELPAGWGWVKLGSLASQITDGEHFRPATTEQGIPFLSAKDVRADGVSFDAPLFISLETAEKAWARCHPERNDILIVSRGATVGRMCAVNTDQPFCLLGSVILIKVTPATLPTYLLAALKAPFVNKKIVGASGATAQQAIYLRDIQSVPVAVCSLEEQFEIVQELESKLSEADQLDQTLVTALQQADALRQSILKKAFCGALVKQDKNDEPATALLERIRAERLLASGKKTRSTAGATR